MQDMYKYNIQKNIIGYAYSSMNSVFFPLNFTSNLGVKRIFQWVNNGKIPVRLSRPAITRPM